MKKYKVSFDVGAIILFLIIMIPNMIWFAIPSPNDILRAESVTKLVDMIASISQVVMLGILCVFVNAECEKYRLTRFVFATIISCVLYFICWILYYAGITNDGIILGMTICPCLAFLFFAIDRKNYIAIVPIVVFMACHLIYGIVNFII